jgi:hypothetical protein
MYMRLNACILVESRVEADPLRRASWHLSSSSTPQGRIHIMSSACTMVKAFIPTECSDSTDIDSSCCVQRRRDLRVDRCISIHPSIPTKAYSCDRVDDQMLGSRNITTDLSRRTLLDIHLPIALCRATDQIFCSVGLREC